MNTMYTCVQAYKHWITEDQKTSNMTCTDYPYQWSGSDCICKEVDKTCIYFYY